jgi:hypothetical protein
MNRLICLMAATTIIAVAACKTQQHSNPVAPASPAAAPVPSVATPRITMVHVEQRFVVIDFSTQAMPAIGQRLSVYRADKRVGEVRLTEPVRARFATADILTGEVRVGDEVR